MTRSRKPSWSASCATVRARARSRRSSPASSPIASTTRVQLLPPFAHALLVGARAALTTTADIDGNERISYAEFKKVLNRIPDFVAKFRVYVRPGWREPWMADRPQPAPPRLVEMLTRASAPGRVSRDWQVHQLRGRACSDTSHMQTPSLAFRFRALLSPARGVLFFVGLLHVRMYDDFHDLT